MFNLSENFKIITLIIKKDIKESLKNRTAVMIILLPLFASLMFSLVNSQQLMRNFEIGISGPKTEKLVEFVNANYKNFEIKKYQELEKGREATAAGSIDAVMAYNPNLSGIENKYKIYLDSRDTINFLF